MVTLFIEIDYLMGSQLSLFARLLSEAGGYEEIEYQFKDKGLYVVLHEGFKHRREYSEGVLNGMKTMKIIENWTYQNGNPSE